MANSMLRSLDVGVVNGHYFFHGACIGPAADEHGYRGKKGFHAEVVCDGHVRHLVTVSIAIGIGHYASEEPIEEDDAIDHHQLFFSSHVPARWRDRLWHSRVRDRPFDVAQASEIQVITDEAMTVYVDGQPVTRTPATFTLLWNS